MEGFPHRKAVKEGKQQRKCNGTTIKKNGTNFGLSGVTKV
ncbi:hypothetical protein FLA_2076 [Filimonas lacunae]|nr:hypothetical protein FLA_2076 [Filimonas lacunae]